MHNSKLLLSKLLLASLAVLSSLVATDRCRAQVARYQPSRTTVSPYLNLTRRNDSGLPNYYALVRPQQHQHRLNVQEQALRRQQGTQLGKLQTDLRLGRASNVTTGTGSQFLTPGTRSGFQNTSRFYPQPQFGNRR